MVPPPESGAFHSGRPGLRKLLGDLEADIMEAVWRREMQPVTVREVFEELQADRKLAYTTVMTVMGILAKKGILEVEAAGRAYTYRPAQTREAFTDAAVARIVDELVNDFADPAIAHFARALKRKR